MSVLMTVLLHMEDNYLREFDATVTKVGDDFIPRLVPIRSTNSDQVEIIPNRVYRLERQTTLGGPAGATISIGIFKVLTPEEQAIEDKEADDFLERLINESE